MFDIRNQLTLVDTIRLLPAEQQLPAALAKLAQFDGADHIDVLRVCVTYNLTFQQARLVVAMDKQPMRAMTYKQLMAFNDTWENLQTIHSYMNALRRSGIALRNVSGLGYELRTKLIDYSGNPPKET